MNTRASRYGNGARIAYHLTQAALPRSSHPKSPHHSTLPQVAACVLLLVSRDRSSRDMAAWLVTTDQVRQALELTKVPDHTTVQRTVKKLRLVDVEKMKNQLLEEQGGDDEHVAADRTGCSPGQASRWDLTRTGRRSHRWAKGVDAVGTQLPCILAWRSGWGPGSDGPNVSGLRCDARRYGRSRGRRKAWVILAAAGCDGHAVRADALVPPVRRGGHLVHPERKARADLVAHARLDSLVGQRWQRETVHSVITRTVGDTRRARTRSRQRREPLSKGLVYTIHRYLRLDVSDRCNKATFSRSIAIFALGACAFAISTAGGVLFAQCYNLFTRNKINPLIGVAGVPAVPMSARVAHTVAQVEDRHNFLIWQAMCPNVAGVIGSAVAAGVMLVILH